MRTQSAGSLIASVGVTFISKAIHHIVGVERQADLVALYTYCLKGIVEIVSRMSAHRYGGSLPVESQTLAKSEVAWIR
jgi:hypothetical protein